FNSVPIPQPSASWLKGGTGLPQVWPWLASIRAGGGTEPVPAFQVAFRLKPRPDTIFFMTDGLIPANVPTVVASLNDKQPVIPVHTILFASGNPFTIQRAAAPLVQIASQSGGTFRAVQVQNFAVRPWVFKK